MVFAHLVAVLSECRPGPSSTASSPAGPHHRGSTCDVPPPSGGWGRYPPQGEYRTVQRAGSMFGSQRGVSAATVKTCTIGTWYRVRPPGPFMSDHYPDQGTHTTQTLVRYEFIQDLIYCHTNTLRLGPTYLIYGCAVRRGS